MICDNCTWNYADEVYPYCIGWRRKSMPICHRFHQVDKEWLNEIKGNKNSDSVCPVCGRDKDPGKCWWCGN